MTVGPFPFLPPGGDRFYPVEESFELVGDDGFARRVDAVSVAVQALAGRPEATTSELIDLAAFIADGTLFDVEEEGEIEDAVVGELPDLDGEFVHEDEGGDNILIRGALGSEGQSVCVQAHGDDGDRVGVIVPRQALLDYLLG